MYFVAHVLFLWCVECVGAGHSAHHQCQPIDHCTGSVAVGQAEEEEEVGEDFKEIIIALLA